MAEIREREPRHPAHTGGGYNGRMKRGTTTLDVPDPATVEMLRSKTAAERLKIASAMWRSARSILTNILRQDHPDWDQRRIDLEVASRLSHGSV